MAEGRKAHSSETARIETSGFPRLVPPYGGSADHLPDSFMERFEEWISAPASEDLLDPGDWQLLTASAEFGYHTGADILDSVAWTGYIMPLESDLASADDVLHAAFATLSGLGLDDCEIIDLIPFEQLLLRVYDSSRLLAAAPKASARATSIVTRGICAAIMDLAYGGSYDPSGRFGLGTFTCSQTLSFERGDLCDEFFVTRRPR
ncbi:MAG TPA: hypothetical protein VGK32_14305 [Vicinamibacterales bacterium]